MYDPSGASGFFLIVEANFQMLFELSVKYCESVVDSAVHSQADVNNSQGPCIMVSAGNRRANEIIMTAFDSRVRSG